MADSFFGYLSTANALGMMLIGFCFLIFIHELGHFLAAKLVDMKVSQFALGIGPAIFSWRQGIGFRRGSTEAEYDQRILDQIKAQGKDLDYAASKDEVERLRLREEAAAALRLGETEYRVNWAVILGGYVKLLGQEDLKPEAVSADSRSFNRKPAWARAVVLSAGVFMNLIFGILFFIIAFTAGVTFPPATAGLVIPNSPAAEALPLGHEKQEDLRGIRTGDRVTHVNGSTTVDFTDISLAAALSHPGDTLDLTVERPGHPQPLTYRVTPRKLDSSKFLAVGITEPLSLNALFGPDANDMPKGIRAGSTITQIDGRPISRFDEFLAPFAASQGRPLTVTFRDPETGAVTDAQLKPDPVFPTDEKTGDLHLLGVVPVTRIAGIFDGTPADKAGVEPGDLIARLGSQSWPSTAQVKPLVKAAQGRPMDLVVWRDNELKTLPPVAPNAKGQLGIHIEAALDAPFVAAVLPGSPLAPLGLNAGSQLVALNDQKIGDYKDLAIALAAAKPDAAELTYRKNLANAADAQASLALTPEQVQASRALPWGPPFALHFETLRTPLAASNPVKAAALGFKKTHQFMAQTYLTLIRLFQQTVPVSELRGVVGIAHEGTRIAKHGWTYLCFFLGLISVNLVVMNFLPIPILDGGQMLFLLIEKLKGSPVSIRAQEVATYIGLAIILSLLLVTLYFDTGRLLGFAS